MTSGLVTDIQRYSIHDGPGIRTLVFLKGCPLRCVWCANPETHAAGIELLFLADRCTRCGRCATVCAAGVHHVEPDCHELDRPRCAGCGGCEAECPAEALRLAGRTLSALELVEVAARDEPFYRSSGGGLTIGGGEPTAQPEFLLAILAEARRRGLHTAVETCGLAPPELIAELARTVDVFLYDIKHLEPGPHRALTGASNEAILANVALLLECGSAVIIRMPLVAGLNDGSTELRPALRYLAELRSRWRNLLGVELLPCHRLGLAKYTQLGRTAPMQPRPHSRAELDAIEESLELAELPARLVAR